MTADQWNEVKSVFESAVDVEQSLRSKFLDSNCSDEAVRAEVLRLLEHYNEAGQFSEGAVQATFSAPAVALGTGTSLGRYQLAEIIGAGGMGEVYRGRDPQLGRDVAIKIIRTASVSPDASQMRRFEQEARAAAALNHPNILAVFDVGNQNGIPYIVSELLDGRTLRARLSEGPLTLAKTIHYGLEIARGLSAAHDKGILHRDLKPENIFVTRDDRIKILDFGLAKLVKAESSITELSTRSSESNPGTIIGTLGYMSPEQLRGRAADARTDVFALGAILYEMASGRRAFRGESPADVASAILNKDPLEVPEGPADLPPQLELIIRHCLEKDPAQRFQSTHDVYLALGIVRSSPRAASKHEEVPAPKPGFPRARRIWAGLAVLLLIATAFLGGLFSHKPVHHPQYRQLTFRQGWISAARFMADGRTVIYSAAWGGPTTKVYSAAVDGTNAKTLELPDAALLAVSRSGELAVQVKGRRLARTPQNGGAPRELLDDVLQADWAPDGNRLAVAHIVQGKVRIEFPIGHVVYELPVGFLSHLRLSPQADAIAFMEHPVVGDDRGYVTLVELGGSVRRLTQEWLGEQGLAWSPDGKEVWFTATNTFDNDRAIYAVTRNGKQRLVLGAPGGMYLEDISPDGRLLIQQQQRRYEVIAGNVGEATNRLLSWQEIMTATALSRDEKFVVVGDLSGNAGTDYGAYLMRLDGGPPILLGSGMPYGISPDGKWVTSILPTDSSKVLLLPTGVGETKIVATPGFHYQEARWASDGRRLVFRASEEGRASRFWVQEITGGKSLPITPEGAFGQFFTMDHKDYVYIQKEGRNWLLYSLDGSMQEVTLGEGEEIVGGAIASPNLYVGRTDDPEWMAIDKLDINTGRRQPLTVLASKGAPGMAGIFSPMFTADEKQYVFNQVRMLSVLHLVDGLKAR